MRNLVAVTFALVLMSATGCDNESGFTASDRTRVNPPPEEPVVIEQPAADAVPEPVIPPPERIALDERPKTCANTESQSLAVVLNYPERIGCNFGVDPNLTPNQGTLQAREVQSVPIAIDASIEVCSISLKSQSNAFRYDDFMLLTVNDLVLVSSNNQIPTGLDKKGDVYVFDFTKVRGMPLDFESDYYCIGPKETCKIPGHDLQGAVDISFDAKTFEPVAKNLMGAEKLDFQLIVTGDNDAVDCRHTELVVDLTVNYVVK